MAWCALRSRLLPLSPSSSAAAAAATPHRLLLCLLSTAAPRHSHGHHHRRRHSPAAYAAAAEESPRPMPPIGRATRHPAGATPIARFYADANSQRPKEYWDYEALDIEWG